MPGGKAGGVPGAESRADHEGRIIDALHHAFRHSRESGNPCPPRVFWIPMDSRFRGSDE